MKHFYKNIDSEHWFDYEELYTNAVNYFNDGSHFVEVGVWKGMSACFMAVEIINSKKQIKFDCIDTWKFVDTSSEIEQNKFKNLFDIFVKNIEPVKHIINIKKEISWEGAKLYEDQSLDFVFIDAGHDFASVSKDLNAWFPKIKKGGIIAGHDYNNSCCEVKQAVDSFFKPKLVKSHKTRWFYKV